MKTPVEMQLKILDKMRENVERGLQIVKGVQYDSEGTWYDKVTFTFDFESYIYRIKPQTITINGVEIPKPLGGDEILGDEVYYHVDNSEFLYEARHGKFIADHGIRFVYETKEEAIEASKLLFGITG